MYSQFPPSGRPEGDRQDLPPSLPPQTEGTGPLAELRFEAHELRELQKRLLAEPFDVENPYPLADLDNRPVLDSYTNGAFVGEARQLQELDATSGITGPQIELNSNAHSSWVIDATNGLLGIISPGLGRLVEYGATKAVMQDILEKLGTDKTIRRFCHSQGAIIESNALFYLKDYLSHDQWNRLTAKLEVVALGPAIFEWPKGVHVRSFAFDADPCPTIVGVVDTLFRPMQWFRSSQRVKPTVIPLDGEYTWFQAHSLPRYMNHMHRFFIADLAPQGAEEFAVDLVSMMREERFTDQLFDRILDSVFTRSEPCLEKFNIQRFCEIVLEAAEADRIGGYRPTADILDSLTLFALAGSTA